MRIVFLTAQLPYPPHSGGALRAYNLLKNLALNHEVHLVSFAHAAREPSGEGELQRYCSSVKFVPMPPSRSFEVRARDTLFSPFPDLALRLASPDFVAATTEALSTQNFDILQIEGLETATHLLWGEICRLREPKPLVVLDEYNAEYLLQKRAFEADARSPAGWLGAVYSWIQWKKLIRYESLVCRGAQRVLAVSEEDRQAILDLVPGIAIEVIPNGVDAEYYSPYPSPKENLPLPWGGKAAPRNVLLFTGTMDFRPNVDAMIWFCREMLPEVVHHVPDVHLYIVGRSPTRRVKSLAGPHVTVVGGVDDDRPYFWGASAYVLPMRFGGGVRLKLLQAMACGLPVISTSQGAEGVAATHGREILLGDQPGEFAKLVVEVLRNPFSGRDVGMKGRELAIKSYEWKVILPKLEETYSKLMEQGRGDGQPLS